MITDGHNHTKHFSPDAEQSVDELILSAKAKGCKRVGITEHYEIDFPDDGINWEFDLNEYRQNFDSWKKRSGDVELLMGLEFGYQSHVAAAIDKKAAEVPLDVVLLSVHLFRGKDFYTYRDCYEIPSKELHKEYVGLLAEMSEKCNNFDVAAHYDYINRYTDKKDSFVLYEECPDEFDRFFEALISKEKALEINTKSILKHKEGGFTRTLPDPVILKRYREMGGKLITLGSDSHFADSFGVCFDEATEYLRTLGFKEAFYFKDHKPYAEPL